MRIETKTDFNTLAAQDAEQRDLSGIEFPARVQVENGLPFHASMKPMPKDTDAPAAPAPFVIDDEGSASWVLGLMAGNAAEIARVKKQAAERIAQLETDARSLESKFREPLRLWAEGEAARRRRKSVVLLDGTLTFRTVGRKLIIRDEEAAFVHARTSYPELIKTEEVTSTKTTFDTAAYIKAAESTGELLPGMDSLPERENFTIDISGGKEPKGGAPEKK